MQKARRALQKAEKAARESTKFGGKTISDPKNPGKYISVSAKDVKAKYAKNILKKSHGKAGIITAAVAGIAALGALITDSIYKNHK